ncbi:MAG: glycosyltransferase family 39 protein [Rhizobiaceae bacterium]|nr:glycosyltransferase family 39 protein [Rhizobiaceae bacterium]
MNADSIQPSRALLLVALAVLICLKTAMLFAPPIGDEAYYWMWGQFLDWSYHDHPPLNALLLRASYELFGWNLFALRAPGLLTWAISFALIGWWGVRLAGQGGALAAIVIAGISPLFFVFQSIVYNDHALIAGILVSVHFFVLFVESSESGRPRWLLLYAAALFVGVAALAKYSAVFIGLGYAFWFLGTPAGRKLLTSPHVWLAGLLACATQVPVIWWNYTHDLTSFRFHFAGRFFGARDAMSIMWRLLNFLIVATLIFSPFLIPGLVRFLRNSGNGDLARFRSVVRPALLLSLVIFSAFALRMLPHFYWLIPPLAAYLPVAAVSTGPREALWHIGFSLFVTAVLTVHIAVVPVSSLFGVRGVEDVAFGAVEIAERAQAEMQAREADLMLTTSYTLASLIGFHLRRTDIYSYLHTPEQYDVWFRYEDHAGKSAIVVTDSHRPAYQPERDRFESFEEIGKVRATRFGIFVNEFTLYHATGLRP